MFKKLFESLGLKKRSAIIQFLGLDNAGKTTLLTQLKDGKFMACSSPNYLIDGESFIFQNVSYRAFDMVGHQSARSRWRDYIQTVNAIIYIVDSADSQRFNESREELEKILSALETANVPILILGNKIDRVQAVTEQELRKALGISEKQQNQETIKYEGRPMEVFMCSAVKRVGYAEGFNWLQQFLH